MYTNIKNNLGKKYDEWMEYYEKHQMSETEMLKELAVIDAMIARDNFNRGLRNDVMSVLLSFTCFVFAFCNSDLGRKGFQGLSSSMFFFCENLLAISVLTLLILLLLWFMPIFGKLWIKDMSIEDLTVKRSVLIAMIEKSKLS